MSSSGRARCRRRPPRPAAAVTSTAPSQPVQHPLAQFGHPPGCSREDLHRQHEIVPLEPASAGSTPINSRTVSRGNPPLAPGELHLEEVQSEAPAAGPVPGPSRYPLSPFSSFHERHGSLLGAICTNQPILSQAAHLGFMSALDSPLNDLAAAMSCHPRVFWDSVYPRSCIVGRGARRSSTCVQADCPVHCKPLVISSKTTSGPDFGSTPVLVLQRRFPKNRSPRHSARHHAKGVQADCPVRYRTSR